MEDIELGIMALLSFIVIAMMINAATNSFNLVSSSLVNEGYTTEAARFDVDFNVDKEVAESDR